VSLRNIQPDQARRKFSGEIMKEYYTRKEAMELLGLRSTNGFLQMTRKYPDAFVNVNQTKHRTRDPWYDKATLDRFHQMREYFKQVKL
jgi:hypothetical protein